jgi:hypothetical protein
LFGNLHDDFFQLAALHQVIYLDIIGMYTLSGYKLRFPLAPSPIGRGLG